MSYIEQKLLQFAAPDQAFSYFGDKGDDRLYRDQAMDRARIWSLGLLAVLTAKVAFPGGVEVPNASAQEGLQPGACVGGYTYLGGNPAAFDQRGNSLTWVIGCDSPPVEAAPVPTETEVPTPFPTDIPPTATAQLTSTPVPPTPSQRPEGGQPFVFAPVIAPVIENRVNVIGNGSGNTQVQQPPPPPATPNCYAPYTRLNIIVCGSQIQEQFNYQQQYITIHGNPNFPSSPTSGPQPPFAPTQPPVSTRLPR